MGGKEKKLCQWSQEERARGVATLMPHSSKQSAVTQGSTREELCTRQSKKGTDGPDRDSQPSSAAICPSRANTCAAQPRP
eukprot:15480344-Alexandrium_andersonii.AAC.1